LDTSASIIYSKASSILSPVRKQPHLKVKSAIQSKSHPFGKPEDPQPNQEEEEKLPFFGNNQADSDMNGNASFSSSELGDYSGEDETISDKPDGFNSLTMARNNLDTGTGKDFL
jgi:hypothetical protein